MIILPDTDVIVGIVTGNISREATALNIPHAASTLNGLVTVSMGIASMIPMWAGLSRPRALGGTGGAYAE